MLHQTVHKSNIAVFHSLSIQHLTEWSNRNLTSADILTSISVKSLVVLLVILNERDFCPSNCFEYNYFYMKCFLSPQKSWFWHASLLCLNYVLLKVYTAACSLGEDYKTWSGILLIHLLAGFLINKEINVFLSVFHRE